MDVHRRRRLQRAHLGPKVLYSLCCAAEYVNTLTMFKTKENIATLSRSFKNTKFVWVLK